MRQWTVIKDQIYDLGEVPYLGVPYNKIENGEVGVLPKDYNGWFPFLRMCYSIGDLAIVSGVFEALKTKYPKIKIAWPSSDTIKHIVGDISHWDYSSTSTAESNIQTIMGNVRISHLIPYQFLGHFM